MNEPYIYGDTKDVVQANKQLLNELKQTNIGYDKVYGIIGSNRQSMNSDILNATMQFPQRPPRTDLTTPKGSACPTIMRVCEYLGVTVEKLLLADLYHRVPKGTWFDIILKHIEENGVQYISAKVECESDAFTKDFKNSGYVFEEHKITLVYAQMHHFASIHPEEKIEFDFFDDKKDILAALYNYYSKNPSMIPPNVTLNLHKYDGDKTPRINANPLHGNPQSIIDTNYGNTLIKMATLATTYTEEQMLDQMECADMYADFDSITPEMICLRKQMTHRLTQL